MNRLKKMIKRDPSQLLYKLCVMLFLSVGFEIMMSNQECLAQSRIKTHAVLYGGISDDQLDAIAKNNDILIMGKVKDYQLKKIKKINPNIIILKYQHCIGMHATYTDWIKVNNREEWFVHDKITGKRMVQTRYNWYLMDITNNEWQRYWVDKIVEATEDIYDGVFLDDFWGNYVDKFRLIDSTTKPDPEDTVIHNWNSSMINILKQLRPVYKKLIYINGTSESYISYVDGCMAESFVHSSWNSDSYFHDSASYLRSLAKINNLKKYGKIVLIQSGTKNDGTGNIMDIFNYCYASFMLIYDDKTSFYFLPQESASSKNITYYPLTVLGNPEGPYYTYYEETGSQNLIPNADFKEGFKGWILSGTPYLSDENNGRIVLFKGDENQGDLITSDLIPVSPSTRYILSAVCKSERNASGSAGYKKLGIHLNYLNAEKKYIGFGDTQFDEGQYDWLPFEAETDSPQEAAYVKIQVGFRGDGAGKGWVNDIKLCVASPSAKILRRDFEYGTVLVNCGDKDYLGDNQIIKAHQGVILIDNHLNQNHVSAY